MDKTAYRDKKVVGVFIAFFVRRHLSLCNKPQTDLPLPYLRLR
jgi:hypothetical protein